MIIAGDSTAAEYGPERAPRNGWGQQLQGFLERGVEAFRQLGDAPAFLGEIERGERSVSARLFAGDADPFG